jgi:excisionase family DNA binding protein
MNEGLRNIDQAAAWLGISKRTLEEYVTARSVPFTKVGRHVRFTQAHLDAIVAAGEQPVIEAPTRLQAVRPRSARRVA